MSWSATQRAASATAPPSEWGLTAFGATGLIRLMSAGTVENVPSPVQETVEAYAPYSVRGLYGEMASIEETVRQAGGIDRAPGSLGSRPVLVLTRGRFDGDREAARATRDAWMTMQRELAALSTRSDHRLVREAGHFIHLDDPDVVVQAIRDVVLAVRENTPLDRLHTSTAVQ